MFRTKFNYDFKGQKVKVMAKAKDVDSYGAVGLSLKFMDDEDEVIELPYIKKVFEEIEEIAAEKLYEKKYADELEFG